MEKKNLFLLSAVVFGIVSLTHLLRIVMDWSIIVNGLNAVPMWLSWFAFVLTGYLSYSFFNLKK
tara:strand:+ start:319 stop:510 length:192 start_codon:yes stop_codon:yes gene_type:complete